MAASAARNPPSGARRPERAAPPAAARAHDRTLPIHIHVAEQTREVEACLAWSGKRPVELLFDRLPVDEHWCLIHATHVTDIEVDGMIARRAVAGLCPITEANLGDGIFPARRFLGLSAADKVNVADLIRSYMLEG